MENNIFQKLCKKITSHKYRECYGWCDYTDVRNPIEYHYRCKICGNKFWNYQRPSEKQNKSGLKLPPEKADCLICENFKNCPRLKTANQLGDIKDHMLMVVCFGCHAFKRKGVENGRKS